VKLYKVSFLPILARGDNESVVTVGRYMVYVTAEDVFRIGDVLRHFLPELFEEGFTVEETIPVDYDHRAYSVSVGPKGRSYSMVITGISPEEAMKALRTTCVGTPVLNRYVEEGFFETRLIDMTKEGVW
jgi:hypothetical protein